jgi:hypothetical protein
MRLSKKFWLTLAIGVAVPAIARAEEWTETRTAHFIVYVNDDAMAARDFAGKLEEFDAALRRLYGIADDPDRHANPVRIFAARRGTFDEICECSDYFAGFYQAAAGKSSILSLYSPKVDAKAKAGQMTSQSVLLHEYTHHFMYSNFQRAYPLWYSEGFAEFNANVIFNPDRSITIGLPANYRARAVLSTDLQMSPNEFFQPTLQTRLSWYGNELLYGRGWLLTHYLTLNRKRDGQLAAYLDAINRGKSSLEAAKAAFGDLRTLWRELLLYGRGTLAAPVRLPPAEREAAVVVTPMSAGVIEMLPMYARLITDSAGKDAGRDARKAEKVAERYPQDVLVQTQLAELADAARQDDLAAAAAGRVLALEPNNLTAMLVQGQVAVRRAKASAGDAKAWNAARRWFLKANGLQPNAPRPLLLYYASFVAAKQEPSPGAIKGLSRAAVLAPEDPTVRTLLAARMLKDGDPQAARELLQPVAFVAHDNRKKSKPQQALELIDAGKIAEAAALMAADDQDKERGK